MDISTAKGSGMGLLVGWKAKLGPSKEEKAHYPCQHTSLKHAYRQGGTAGAKERRAGSSLVGQNAQLATALREKPGTS
jgi:hypothetical protein